MFSWTVVCAGEHEALARGEAPPGFLSPREREKLDELVFPARRRKWLLGRWAAKRLIGEALRERLRTPPDLEALTIGNEPSGAPYAELEGVGRLPWRLSLSHREDLALAVLDREPDRGLGADLEMVVPRDEALVRDFFTEEEVAQVARASGRDREILVARIWSAKEAILKALGIGLRLDTRRIAVHREGPLDSGHPLASGWRSLDVTVGPMPGGKGPKPDVFWRDEGRYVISVALLRR